MSSVTVRLKAGRERPVLHGHPWVFSGAVEEVKGEAAVGAIAEVVSRDGNWLARGLYHPDAALSVRLYTREQKQPLDHAFFAAQLDRAIALRENLFPGRAAASGRAVLSASDGGGAGGPRPTADEETNAYRLVYSESDGLSGLIVDRYADVLAVQVGAKALMPFLEPMLKHLADKTGIRQIHVSAEEDSVEREKIDSTIAVSEFAPDRSTVRIKENGFAFDVDLAGGQKTGFFLDQRVNRQRVAAHAKGRRVLSAYCYTGGFEIYAAGAGAAGIVGIDRSEPALKRAEEHHRLNGTAVPVAYSKADVPEALRRYRDAGETFDMVILDPPRFVANKAQKEKGMRAYKDINLLAMKLLSAGGVLATFSCSGLISMDDFKTVIGWAAVDSGRNVRIIEVLGQPPDHPILAVFPESDYLKGLICWVE